MADDLSFTPILVRILRRIEEVWFDKSAKGWSDKQRFACAWVGAFTFGGTFYVMEVVDKLSEFDADSALRWILPLPAAAFLLVAPAWFAWMVSSRDLGHGPVRLYLSGLVLPALVWVFIKSLFF